MNIGFIGLGIMGSRIAKNLQKKGCQLTVYNRSKDKAEPLLANGATWATSPSEAAKDADIVITMLAHPDAITETALGENGFLSAMKPRNLWIDSSTLNPSFTKQLAVQATSKGICFLDAPVAGSKTQAEGAQLVFL